MEWTDEHIEAFRNGLEQSTEGSSPIPMEEKQRLYTASRKAFYEHRERTYQSPQLRAECEENVALSNELERCKNAEHSMSVARDGQMPSFVSTPTPSGETKTVTVGGKQFTVPASWTRQQIRQWSRNNPEQGR